MTSTPNKKQHPWQKARNTGSPDKFCAETPCLMGIVNVTPDSFSDGGSFLDSSKAINHGKRLIDEGAMILDIGGESTRPGAAPVSQEEELNRVLPVIEGLSDICAQKGALLSIDTRHTGVMSEAIKAGANFVNDVNALRDEGAIDVVAGHDIPVCLMHMQGTPETMQESPTYDNIIDEVFAYLSNRITECVKRGLRKENIVADIGIGFGKTLDHNIELLKNIAVFHQLDVTLLVGTSRKSFISKIDTYAMQPEDRLGGSLVTVLDAAHKGVQIVRVHDVAQTRQALLMAKALR